MADSRRAPLFVSAAFGTHGMFGVFGVFGVFGMFSAFISFAALARPAFAAGPTPGYPEAVVQWGVQKGETCEDIAKVLYGAEKHVLLLQRYNRVTCKAGTPLREGMTLVLPEKVTVIPDARMRSMNPAVRARPAGGGWVEASEGMALYSSANVNTLEQGRADIEFIDRTRVFLAPNTLVVIYGTANQTRVSRTPPAAVEVEAGEVKAGLSALRGEAVEVAIKGGGRVSAASRDTVVQKKGERTTIAVFDGKAGVNAGGKSLTVPKDFGTRFVGNTPPAPPRPLPPAPAWAPGGTEGIALAPQGQGLITATWEPVPVAVAYRIELGRDESFNDLVVRTEVPADIHAFRAEKLPPGAYHLRVRAIDKEEYLGIASTARVIRLIYTSLSLGSGSIKPREVEANPYGVLRFLPSPDTEMALDEGPFGPMLESLDLQQRAPQAIRLRPRGATAEEQIHIHYIPVVATLAATPAKDLRSLDIQVAFTGLDGVDVMRRVAPVIRVRALGRETAPLSRPLAPGKGTSFGAVVPLSGAPGELRVDVVDGRGVLLGTSVVALQKPPEPLPPPHAPRPIPTLGVTAPLWQLSSVTDVLWFTPTAPNAASVSASAGVSPGAPAWAVQGQVRASGSIDALGIDAAVRSSTTGASVDRGGAWLGARYRALRLEDGSFELAPALRVGLPLTAEGAPPRLEIAAAAGGAAGRFTFVADAGLRFRPQAEDTRTQTPKGQGFLLAGATLEIVPWLRLHTLVDAHFIHRDRGDKAWLGGLGAGVEAGRSIFGALSLRASPWTGSGDGMAEGPLSAQLAIGIREFH